MSIEYCEHCGQHIDTDFDVEGEYEAAPGVVYGRFRCSRCCEKRDEPENELLRDDGALGMGA